MRSRDNNGPAGGRPWTARYPPLVAFVAACLLAVIVLPSALNVPQSNPTQTLEFAPVPPDDDAPPPPTGNTSSLGLGSSSSIPGDALGAGGGMPPLPPPLPDGEGARPATKRCVGDPPRQTEDQMSPPCVAHFEGDNFGATYRGVDAEEITILFYLDPQVWSNTDQGSESETSYAGRYFDLGVAPQERETVSLRNLRRFQRYFNDRYQVYGRNVRFWAYFSVNDEESVPPVKTPETRRADALDNLDRVEPFAVFTTGTSGSFEQPYIETMADAGVLVFGSQGGVQPASFFQRFAGLVWSYLPTVEKQAELYATYVCEQVLGRPVVDSGNPGDNGGPRTLGFLSPTDERKPHLVLYAREIKRRLEACGAQFAATATFPQAGAATQARSTQDPAALYASRNVATFQQAEVTTVIWAGGFETDHSRAAARADYLPEWILAGDGQLEAGTAAPLQDQEAFDHAWVATTVVRVVEGGDDPCRAALREADPSVGSSDQGWGCSYFYYRDLRQLFTGIQVAGPRLTPVTMEQGFRAIPSKASTDATIPACFYEPGDYTCVKDATAEWWDPQAQDDGCWRMVEGGRRYLAGAWPAGNIDQRRGADDPCNLYSTPVLAF